MTSLDVTVYSNQLNGEDSDFALEKLSELGRLVDDTARTFFNLTIGTSSSLTYGNALFVILAVSVAVLGGMVFLLMASNSVLSGHFQILLVFSLRLSSFGSGICCSNCFTKDY